MADRTAAALFGQLFALLAEDKPQDPKAIALDFWKQSRDYDFSHYQMYCDEALQKLGLAKMGIDPDDGERRLLYAEMDGTFEEGWEP